MSKPDSRSAETAARRAKIPALWNSGLTSREIAGRLGVSVLTARADIAMLQAGNHIKKRFVPARQLHRAGSGGPGGPPSNPARAGERDAARVRSAAAYAEEVAGLARAKRIVTVSRADGELRVVKFFADAQEAAEAERLSITGVRPGVVTGDVVYMAAHGHGASQTWAVWQDMMGSLAA